MVRRPRGQRAEGTVSRKHPTVAAQHHRMLHHRGGHHKGPYCKVARGLIGSTKLDVQAVARRSSQRGKFTKTTPGSRSVFPFASNGCGPRREYPVQHFAPDEGMRGTSVEERHATKRHEGVSSAVNRDLRDERGVVKRNYATNETGAVF